MGHLPRWFSTITWGATGSQQGLAAVIAAVIFWAQASADPGVELDPSWQAGLALARMHDLAWGPEIVFTYGPLGFLQTSVYYAFDQSLMATVYQPIVIAALFLGIAAALRQHHAPTSSLIGAFIATGIASILHMGNGTAPGLRYPELAFLAAFAWAAVPLLQREPKRSAVLTTCIALSAVAGFHLLVKFNIGMTIVVIALALSVLQDWRAVGRHCATVAAFAASILISWVFAGQRLGDLPAWLTSNAALVSGYSEGMSMPLLPFTVVGVVITLGWIVALGMMFVRGGPQIPRRFVVLVGLVTVIAARSALGRVDQWHLFALLGVIVVAVAITPFSRTPRRVSVVIAATMVLVALGTEAVGWYAIGGLEKHRAVAAVQAPGQVADRLVTLALPGHLDQRIEQAKARQRALYGIPDRFLKTIGPGTVHIDPTLTSAAWAYDLAWRPAPVFQTYAAYTPTLDGLNSQSLSTEPQFVLSRRSSAAPATGLDGRLGVQESPGYSRALLCNYTVGGVENGWTLFTRTTPHCGPLTELSQVTVRGNDPITIPAPSRPDMAVLVGIDLQPTVIDRLLQGTVAPLVIPTVVLDGVSYRLVAANAGEPFLVSAPASADGTNLQIHARTIGVGHAPSLGQGAVTARLSFYEMRVAQPTGTPTAGRTPPPPAVTQSVIDAHGISWSPIDNDGTFLVGVDVQPGKYRNTGGALCEWARLRSLDPVDIIAGDKAGGPQVVQIPMSDTAFSTKNCGTWQMVPLL